MDREPDYGKTEWTPGVTLLVCMWFLIGVALLVGGTKPRAKLDLGPTYYRECRATAGVCCVPDCERAAAWELIDDDRVDFYCEEHREVWEENYEIVKGSKEAAELDVQNIFT